ncbi:MAG: metal-dependent hydrolase [Saprospiraceae bacterium]|jgi:L-ascorbate metabolism protein UlaG (beta-lactamase superfamily)|nr:metal-dependent hydrolase [Saprospiraceae bacterium]
MKVTYLGHASFLIETGGKKLIFDPFISANPLVKDIDVDKLKTDYVLVSHGHQDHVVDAEAIIKNNEATLISNYEIATWFGQKGCTVYPVNHGGKVKMDFGTIKYVNAIHSSVLPDGTYGGNPGGFVVWNDQNCFYFAGDTALTWDMKLIPMTCPTLDFAILPIGDNFTMGYEDAVIASDFIACDKIIGCHYDTFPYIEMEKETAQKAFADAGKELILLAIGETIEM